VEKRQYQVFKATLPRGQTLELLPSPWLVDGDVSIPLEHWDVLREVAHLKGLVDMHLWENLSTLDGVRPEPIEIRLFVTGLKLLEAQLRTDMATMLMLTKDLPEPLPGSEHARMLEAVIRVFEKSGSETDSWVE
jgi:hypothetical protein